MTRLDEERIRRNISIMDLEQINQLLDKKPVGRVKGRAEIVRMLKEQLCRLKKPQNETQY